MLFKVGVEKNMYATGYVKVDCDIPGQAIKMVENQIDKEILQTSNVYWSDPFYEDYSFRTTGDVD